jgi:hypothetical protein
MIYCGDSKGGRKRPSSAAFLRTRPRTFSNGIDCTREAEEAVVAGQSYSIGGRSMTRASLYAIREELKAILRQIADLKAAKP